MLCVQRGGLGSGVRAGVLRACRRNERNLLLSALALWAGLGGVRETCNGPGTRALCLWVRPQLGWPLAPAIPGFVCSSEC